MCARSKLRLVSRVWTSLRLRQLVPGLTGRTSMPIPTEQIGSIPRPKYLLDGYANLAAGTIDQAGLDALVDRALTETIDRLAATGSTVLTDGEQAKPSFATYPLDGLALAPDGAVIPF